MKLNLHLRSSLCIAMFACTAASCAKKEQGTVPRSHPKRSVAFILTRNLILHFPQAIDCEIRRHNLCRAFAGTNITRMKAGFATTGAKVTVNGELQVTEQMVHDFQHR